MDPGIGRLADVDLRLAQDLHVPDHGCQAHRPGQFLHLGPLRPGDRHQIGGDRGQERLSEMVGQGARQLGHVVAGLRRLRHADEGPTGVARRQGVGQRRQHGEFVVDGSPGGHLVQSRQGVARRSPAPPHGRVDRCVVQVETGVVTDPSQQIDQRLGSEKPEFEVLCPAADGRKHLLGFGGRQHEDDVTGRLLQRLEQGVGCRRREHVDFVDDVDLPPTRRSQCGVGDELAHGVDTVVGGGIQLVHVERCAAGDLDAGVADPARFAPVGCRAVEGLGQDPGRRRLAGAPRPTEQIGVADPVVAHGVAKGQADVFLPEHFVEPLRAEPSVQRLVRSRCGVAYGGHGRSLPVGSRTETRRTGRCSVRRPGLLRHTDGTAESCCLPALTRFTGARCAGPGRRTEHRAVRARR